MNIRLPVDITFVSLTARWLAGWYLGGHLPTLDDRQLPPVPGSADEEIRTSVIVPARNEARLLPALLSALALDRRPPMQVIVVDDHSTDATAAIAAGAGATVLRSGDLPPGWLGKPWACAQGAAIADGEVLIFLDADTVPSPDLLHRLALVVKNSRSLISVAPYHRTQQLYERASALFNLVALMGTGASSIRRQARITGAFGPCLALRAEDYKTIGGHAAVRHDLLEDVALARVCAAHGIAVRIIAGGLGLRYRMYPDGASQLIEGWSKNFAAGAGSTPPLRGLAIAAWISGVVEAGWWTSAGVARMIGGGAGPSLPHLLFYVLFAFQLWFLLRRIGNFGSAALVHPLLSLAFLLICGRSALLHLRGEVTWKGRQITVRSRTAERDD